MATMLSQKLVEAQEANDTVRDFMRRFEVGKLLSSCRAQKTKGFSVVELFVYLVCCMFSPISTYMSMRIGSYREAFSKNTLYRFCNNAGINWHKFVRLLSEKIISGFIRPATSEQRIEYFIFDDTPFAKSGKKTELVSKFFNHVTMKYERGFRILTMLWSDEYSSIPIDFCPLSSGRDELLTCPAKECDGRSLAGRIRKQARQKAPDILLSMLKDAMKAGHNAKYVLFDSWFATPKGITAIKRLLSLDVLAMLKKSGKVFYEYQERQFDLKRIYAMNRKRPGRSKYLLSVEVNLIQKEKGQVVSRIPVRIVFVRNRSKVDEIIDTFVRSILEKVRAVDRTEIVEAQNKIDIESKKQHIRELRRDAEKAESELQKLQSEIIRSLTGESAFTPQMLRPAIDAQERKFADLMQTLRAAEEDMHDSENNLLALTERFDDVLHWAAMYNNADMAAKKMIVSRIIDRVDMFRNYEIRITLNISIEQFLNTIEIVA